jgi:hypothetical protein
MVTRLFLFVNVYGGNILWYNILMQGSKGLKPHELAHKWLKDLGTRPDMRILGRIVGVQSTEQSAGIKARAFDPNIIIF